MCGHLIKPSTIAYLNQWYKNDRLLIESLALNNPKALGEPFRKLAAKYMVARNFSTTNIKGNGRSEKIAQLWSQVATVVCSVEINDRMSEHKMVHDLANKLGGIFPPKSGSKIVQPTLLSAATKFLWFRGHTSIRIYDKRAVEALNQLQKLRERKSRRVNGDYAAFAKAWNEEFRSYKSELMAAKSELPHQLNWSIVPQDEHDKALCVTKKNWFSERVFDKFLWTIGTGEKGADSFE